MFDSGGRVHFLGDDQRLRFQIKRNSRIRAGRCTRAFHVAFSRFNIGNRIDDGFQMLGSRPAASPDNTDTVVLYKVLVILRQFLWRQLVDGVAAHVLWQSRIRQDRNFLGRIQPQIADGIVHLLRSGCTVQTDCVYFERIKRSQSCPDLCAQQHRPRFLQSDLHLHG